MESGVTANETSFLSPSLKAQFDSHVRQDPERIAICTPNRTVSLSQLDRLSKGITEELSVLENITARPLVVLSSDPAVLAAVLLACLENGAIYAPVDPDQPAARLRGIIAELDAVALVTDLSRDVLARELVEPGIPVIVADRLNSSGLNSSGSGRGYHTERTTSRVLRIMHTSGSMGKPKGVIQIEQNVSRFVFQVANGLAFKRSDRLALAATLNSHAGAVMCLASLCNAVTFYPLDLRSISLDTAVEFIRQQRITLFFTVPSVVSTLGRLELTKNRDFPALRLIRLSGETVTLADIENCRALFPDLDGVSVGYGTTEIGGISQNFFARNSPLPFDPVPVGQKAPGVEIRVVDEQGAQLDFEIAGEIMVISRYFSTGYWNNLEFTRKSFQVLDDGSTRNATGDMGRLDADGMLVHLGRRDFQINRAGNRIEPGEIEHALIKLPTIADAVVRPVNIEGDLSLVAYLVATKGSTGKGCSESSTICTSVVAMQRPTESGL
jgi:acyl-coenzyme A synthetase/AMP-(fatty) acid ligase